MQCQSPCAVGNEWLTLYATILVGNMSCVRKFWPHPGTRISKHWRDKIANTTNAADCSDCLAFFSTQQRADGPLPCLLQSSVVSGIWCIHFHQHKHILIRHSLKSIAEQDTFQYIIKTVYFLGWNLLLWKLKCFLASVYICLSLQSCQ